MATEREPEVKNEPVSSPERRDFIKGLGKFAVLTPPAVAVLLDVSMNSPAVAASGGRPGWGFGRKKHVQIIRRRRFWS